jgi:glycogen debranching enzyme
VEPATTDLSVALVEQTNFAVSDRAGDMLPGTYHGFFVADTRFLSRLILRLNGRLLEPLASGGGEHHSEGTFYLASPKLPDLPTATMTVFRDRTLTTRLEERIRLISYAREPIEIDVSVDLDADFADIFEVRGRRRLRRPVSVERRRRSVRFSYEHGGYRRATVVASDRSATHVDGRLTFSARLEHGQPWDLHLRVDPELSTERGVTPLPPAQRIEPALVRKWQRRLPTLETHDRRLARAWHRGVRDLASLLLVGPAERFIPAAGLPWFLAVFGRDSAITAMQSLLLGPDVAHGTLRQLAAYQGTTADPWREEEPGKIPHEVRTGELATLGRIPFGRYYGSVDATPLYLMLYVAACRWSGWLRGDRRRAPAAVREFLPHAEAALAWIERRSDADGLLWYSPSRRGGIRNQVWKDSNDSMRFADGSIAKPPIAAVEVQGYVVAARRGMADVFDALGRTDAAQAQRHAAKRLSACLQERFWMAGEGTYSLGLDAAGRQIDAVASNAGHLLWTDAIPADRAAAVAERLLAPDMFTGWGIRTLSSRNPGYNPIGYHVGAVWPHDTSLIANGLARAGQHAASQLVIDGLLDAAEAVDGRLPELFAGFDRKATPDLVPYPSACSPQAWATGAIFLSVRTLLGIPAAERHPHWQALDVVGAKEGTWQMAELTATEDGG